MTCLSNNDIVKVGATAKYTLELARFLTSNSKLSELSKLSKALDVRTFVEEATYSFIFTSIIFRDIGDCTLILAGIKKKAKRSEKLWSYCTDEIQKCQNLSDVENLYIRSRQLLPELARCKGVAKAATERENHQPVENRGERLGSSSLGSSSWPKNESSKSGLRNSGRGFGVLLQTRDKLSRKSLAICVLVSTRLDT